MPKDKIFRGILILFVAVSAVMVWTRGNEFVAVENPDKELQGQAYIKYWDKLNEAYKKDNYGGATPEETLDMFIIALKAGDLELASKYFVVEKQDIYLKAFNNWETNGTLNNIMSYLVKAIATKEFSAEFNKFQMVVIQENNQASIVIEFVKNTYTQKWKMYEF